MELAVQRELFVIKSLPRGGRTLEVVRRYGLACNLRYSPLYNGIEIGRKGCPTQAGCEECSQHAIAHGKRDRKSTRLNSSHLVISYAVFCLKKKKTKARRLPVTTRDAGARGRVQVLPGQGPVRRK